MVKQWRYDARLAVGGLVLLGILGLGAAMGSADTMPEESSITLPYPGEIWSVALSPDGDTVAVRASDQKQGETLALWSRSSRTERKRLKSPTGQDLRFTFSADGKQLRGWSWIEAEGQLRGEATTWDVGTGTAKQTLSRFAYLTDPDDPTNSPSVLALSPYAPVAVSAERSGALALFDTETGDVRHTLSLGNRAEYRRPCFSRDGKTLLLAATLPRGAKDAGATIALCDLATGKVTKTLRRWPYDPSAKVKLWSLDLSADGGLIALAGQWQPPLGEPEGKLLILDAKTGETLQSFPLPRQERWTPWVRLAPDAQRVFAGWGAASEEERGIFWPTSHQVRGWELSGGKQVYQGEFPGRRLSMEFTPAGTAVVLVAREKTLRVVPLK